MIACAYVLSIAPLLGGIIGLAGRSWRPAAQFALAVAVSTFPPLFEWVLSFGPDQLCAILTAYGLYLVSLGMSRNCAGRFSVLAGASLLSFTGAVRPELITTLPIVAMVFAFVWLAQNYRASAMGPSILLTRGRMFCLILPLVFTVTGNIGYRWTCFDEARMFGRLEVPCPGVEAWCRTWVNSESECLAQIVWPLGHSNPTLTVESIPSRAFASERERTFVASILADASAAQLLTRELDDRFAELATERIKRNWWLHWFVPRAWRPIHLWVNLELNSQLLDACANIPRWIRRPVLGWFVLQKASILILVLLATRRLLRIPFMNEITAVDLFAMQAVVFVVSRTLLIGVLLGSHEHRYATVAWPLCLVAAAYAIRPNTSDAPRVGLS